MIKLLYYISAFMFGILVFILAHLNSYDIMRTYLLFFPFPKI